MFAYPSLVTFYVDSVTGNTIPSLEEALCLLEVKELKSCAASLGIRGGGGHSSVTRPALIHSILKHANTNQSIKSHFSNRRFSVTDVALNQLSRPVLFDGPMM